MNPENARAPGGGNRRGPQVSPAGKQVDGSIVARPNLIGAAGAARLHDVSERSWWRLDSAGLVPMPVKLGRRTLWSVRELEAWAAHGCPSRERWAEMRSTLEGRR